MSVISHQLDGLMADKSVIALAATFLVIGDWFFGPRTKGYIISAQLLAHHNQKLLGRFTLAQRALIVLAARATIYYTADLWTIYIPSFVSFPTRLTTCYIINYSIGQVLTPAFNYFNFVDTDERNLGLFEKGMVDLFIFISTIWLLRNSVSNVIFLYRLVSNFKSATILAAIGGAFALWQTLPDGSGWKARAKSYFGKKISFAFKYLSYKSVTVIDKFIFFHRKSVNLFKSFDSWVIQKRSNGMPRKEKYEYASFSAPREMRLIRLLRKSLFADIRCELVTVDLDDQPEYEAISYTWGGELPSIDITIDNKTFKVTPAVYDILSYRQNFLSSRCFWIDAVCINQQDLVERGHQVGLMRDIYKQASRVVVWLGPLVDAPDAFLAREQVHAINVKRNVLGLTSEDVYKKLVLRDNPGWDALSRLFAHRWFSRVWVAQEVVVAANIHVMYGRTCTSWSSIASAAEFLTSPHLLGPSQVTDPSKSKSGPDTSTTVDKMAHVRNLALMGRVRQCFQASQPISLGHALFFGMHFQSTDSRDKIYGIMGIVSGELPSFLAPDYTKPVDELYIDTMRYLISHPAEDHVINSIYMAGSGIPRTPEMEAARLPSWVVDWSSQNYGRLVANSITNSCQVTGWTAEVLLTEDRRVIRVQAAEFDRVQTFSPPLLDIETATLADDWRRIGRKYVRWKTDAWEVARIASLELYPTEELMADTFWRTLLGSSYFSGAQDSAHCAANWAFLEKISELGDAESRKLVMESPDYFVMNARLSAMLFHFGAQCGHKRFCITESGRMGLVPHRVMEGDRIYFFLGLNSPLIIRGNTTGDKDSAHHEYVGACLVDGVMGDPKTKDLQWETYLLE